MAQGMVVNNQWPRGEGERVKASWFGYKQGKNKGSNPKSQCVLLEA